MPMSLTSTSGSYACRTGNASSADDDVLTTAPRSSRSRRSNARASGSSSATSTRTPASCTSGRGVGLTEEVEDVRQQGGIDARARIDDVDCEMPADAAEQHLDATASGGELDGVDPHMPQPMLQAAQIATDRSGQRIAHES